MLVHGSEQVTDYAGRNLRKLEDAGYLHSNYERFKKVEHYNKMITDSKLKAVGDKVIEKQKAREEACYKALGVKNAAELNKKYLSDEAVNTFIQSSYNNIYATLADSLKEIMGSSDLGQKVSKSHQKEIANSIEKNFDSALESLSKDYSSNINKLVNGGIISKEMVDSFRGVSNRDKDNKLRKAGQMARSSLAEWKGKLGEIVVGLFASQLNGIKGVEVTGGSIDELGKFIKTDVTSYTDEMSIGFSVKNYATKVNKETGDKYLPRDITLHSGGNFETFLNRLKSLNAGDLQSDVNNIVDVLGSDNYYYSLINEAAHKTTFQSSDPAQDFISTIKGMAAAWFGTQLVINAKEGISGQNVDFFVLSNYGVIPMSVLLEGLKTEVASIKVGISSTASLDEEEIYEKKISQPYNPQQGFYSNAVLNIGHYAGEEVYTGIKVSEIKLSLILSKLRI